MSKPAGGKDGSAPSAPGLAGASGVEQAANILASEAGAHPGESWSDRLTERVASSEAAADAVRLRLGALQESENLLEKIQERWGRTDNASFAGRIFEYHHGTTFNMSAAEHGESYRAIVTEFEGAHPNPHDAADLRVVSPTGTSYAEVQAKVIAGTARRIHELDAERYERLRLAVPSDHLSPTQATLQARIDQANPDFLKHQSYDSILARLDDRIAWDGTASAPITSEQVRAAAGDPEAYFRSLKADEQRTLDGHLDAAAAAAQQIPLSAMLEVVGAAGAGGLTSFTASMMFSAVGNSARMISGEMSPTAAAVAAVTASTGALVRGAFVGGAGQGARLLADAGVLPDVLGGGSVAYVAARATWELGVIGVQLAKGEIDAGEAAARSSQSMLRIGYSYGGMIVGQALIPIPVVGALVGGAVGAICAGITIQGLAAARVRARNLRSTAPRSPGSNYEIEATAIVLDAETQWLRETSKHWNIAFRTQILPIVEQMDSAVTTGDFINAVPKAAQLLEFYGQAPLFRTMLEFDHWMNDSDKVLVLNPNPARLVPGNGRSVTASRGR